MSKVRDIINKVRDISLAYVEDLPIEEDWYQSRLSECLGCEFNTKNGAEVNGFVKNMINSTVVSDEFGQCSLCGCPTERKCSRKREGCPAPTPKWHNIESEPSSKVGSVTDIFTVSCNDNVKSLKPLNGIFNVDIGDTDKDVFLNFDISTHFKGKYVSFAPTCSCTTGSIKKVEEGKYRLTVKIVKDFTGEHKVAFSTIFTRDNMQGRLANVSLQMVVKFNKIK